MDLLVLAYLDRQACHGYELKRRITRTLGGRMEVYNNSLYPTLRRLSEAGAIEGRSETQDGKPPRRVYSITELGREFMHDLLVEQTPQQAASDQDFLLRVSLFGLLTLDERKKILRTRDAALRRQIETLQKIGQQQDNDTWSYEVVSHTAAGLRAELEWVTKLTVLIEEP